MPSEHLEHVQNIQDRLKDWHEYLEGHQNVVRSVGMYLELKEIY